MNLFHVTFNLNHNGIFIPRIPGNADFYTEEAETPRICFAPSLEGCLSSMPLGGYNLKESLEETNGAIKVFTLNTESYPIHPSNIFTPEDLTKLRYVADAWVTGEHWVCQPVTLSEQSVTYLKILSFDMACIGKTGIKPASMYQKGDIDIITNLKYQKL